MRDAAEELGATTVPVQSQSNALMEVAAGTSDAAVIDVLMAADMTGEGTSYADLVYDLNLNDMRAEASEFYGVGFRKGSDLVDAFNEFWKQAVADGTVEQIAATYGLQHAVVLEETISAAESLKSRERVRSLLLSGCAPLSQTERTTPMLDFFNHQ